MGRGGEGGTREGRGKERGREGEGQERGRGEGEERREGKVASSWMEVWLRPCAQHAPNSRCSVASYSG